MTQAPPVLFDDTDIRDRFVGHYKTLRGHIRQEIVRRHLSEVALAGRTGHALRVLDVGCGDGRDSIWLASLGHDVTAIDVSEAMLAVAQDSCAKAPNHEALALAFEKGSETEALHRYGPESFDLVLSHGVIMYQDHPASFVETHLRLVKPDGMFSLLAKNAEALAYRAAHEGALEEAIRLLDDSQGAGHLGVETTAHRLQQIADAAHVGGGTVRSWAGVRIFTDTNAIDSEVAAPEAALELEWKACRRDPYRRSAALIHMLILKGLDLSLLPQG